MLILSFKKQHIHLHSYRTKFKLLVNQNTSALRSIHPPHLRVSHNPASVMDLLVSNMLQVPGPQHTAFFWLRVLHNILTEVRNSRRAALWHFTQFCILWPSALHIVEICLRRLNSHQSESCIAKKFLELCRADE